jgi:hypothetical protein
MALLLVERSPQFEAEAMGLAGKQRVEEVVHLVGRSLGAVPGLRMAFLVE